MRMNISSLRARSNQLLADDSLGSVIGPDINTKLILERFAVSKTTLLPFEDFEVSWLVTTATGNVNIADYQFRLKTHDDILADNIGNQGQTTVAIYKRTLLTLQARLGLRTWKNLGDPITLRIDDSNCDEKDFPGNSLDASISDQLTAGLAGISVLRLRAGKTIESNWYSRYIEYKVPLDLVLNNFFNGDLDITWKLYFSIDYDDNSDCYLDVSISSSENADFHWGKDILSAGHTATIAATIERLMPFILDPIIAKSEVAVASELCSVLGVGNYFDTHKMVSVSIVPNNSFNYLHFMFCDKEISDFPNASVPFEMEMNSGSSIRT